MSFQSRLEDLRAKPDHVRKQFAFWSSFGITAVIFAVWISSFTSFGATSSGVMANAVQSAGTPAQSLVASVGVLYTDLHDLIFAPSKVTYGSVEVLPGKK